MMLIQERFDKFLQDPHLIVRDAANNIRKIKITDSVGHEYEIESVCGGSLRVKG